MKTNLFFIVFIAFAFLTSCTTTKSTTAKSLDIYGSGVIQYPVVANLIVDDTKIIGTAVSAKNKNMTIEAIKNNAISDALKRSNSDILIEPVYEIETSSGETRVTVKGFPGKYDGFRQATIDDAPLLELGVLQKANVAEANQKSSKSNTGAIIGTIIGIFAVIAAIVL